MTREELLQFKELRFQNLCNTCKDLFTNIDESKTLTLEIGSGKGHYLSQYAASFPDEFCVGIDLINKRVIDSKRRAKNLNAKNVEFIKAQSEEFINATPENIKFDNIFIFFPDPWPKVRHHKNRLIQNDFLSDIKKISKANAKIYFRTDFVEYFNWSKEIFENSPDWDIQENNELPIEVVSQFQRMLPEFNTLIAKRK